MNSKTKETVAVTAAAVAAQFHCAVAVGRKRPGRQAWVVLFRSTLGDKVWNDALDNNCRPLVQALRPFFDTVQAQHGRAGAWVRVELGLAAQQRIPRSKLKDFERGATDV